MKVSYTRQLNAGSTTPAVVQVEFEHTEIDTVIEIIKKLEENS